MLLSDINNWNFFKLKDLFNISKTKDSSKINEKGNVPYVSRKSINNGVREYKKVSLDLIEKNCLTIHSEWSDKFICIYHDGDFCADGKVVKLENKNLNKFNGIFISTVISKIITSNYRLDTIKNIKIKLPIDNYGNPDWDYMCKYVKSIFLNVNGVFNKIKNFLKCKYLSCETNYKKFKLKEIFDFPKIKKFSKIPNEIGEVSFITSTSLNNGISKKVKLISEISNAITVSTNGKNFDCFYHDYPFIPSSDVEVLQNPNLNKYNALFICSLIHKEKYKYSYSKKAKNGKVKETEIKIPIDKSGFPDWNYMEKYIKKIYDNLSNIFLEINK